MHLPEQPIGIFDSGIGGLTVARAIHEQLPHEPIVYLGDTARVPYGNKSPRTIQRYAFESFHFLLQFRVKAVVIACNTATAHALASLQQQADTLPVLGVIQPGVQAALMATRTGRIGIIGTPGTIHSQIYQRALKQQRPDVELTVLPTPLLVPLIEEGWIDHPATQLILQEYLAPFQAARIDTLVLACTHYPLLTHHLHRLLGPSIQLVDSAEKMALALHQELQQKNLLRLPPNPHLHSPLSLSSNNGVVTPFTLGRVDIQVTDLSPSFERLARSILGSRLGQLHQIEIDGAPLQNFSLA